MYHETVCEERQRRRSQDGGGGGGNIEAMFAGFFEIFQYPS